MNRAEGEKPRMFIRHVIATPAYDLTREAARLTDIERERQGIVDSCCGERRPTFRVDHLQAKS